MHTWKVHTWKREDVPGGGGGGAPRGLTHFLLETSRAVTALQSSRAAARSARLFHMIALQARSTQHQSLRCLAILETKAT